MSAPACVGVDADEALRLELQGAITRGLRAYAQSNPAAADDDLRLLPDCVAHIVTYVLPVLHRHVADAARGRAIYAQHRDLILGDVAAIVRLLEADSPLPDARHAYRQVLDHIDATDGTQR